MCSQVLSSGQELSQSGPCLAPAPRLPCGASTLDPWSQSLNLASLCGPRLTIPLKPFVLLHSWPLAFPSSQALSSQPFLLPLLHSGPHYANPVAQLAFHPTGWQKPELRFWNASAPPRWDCAFQLTLTPSAQNSMATKPGPRSSSSPAIIKVGNTAWRIRVPTLEPDGLGSTTLPAVQLWAIV